ncbi:hypothetical protein E2562_010544 [Oryza meyeriana var. granulata]|uniref:Uncharacterized protein n=1 Tax=Oryza meyeriana var. granulata TaxID=110450 RepID=A0A6G1BU79_9ORYZ|nr:hypothetical protein E2562_010544 [Oryza meyeriana var. granulata]
MASADAILSSQVAGECLKINKLAAASPIKVQVQKQSEGSAAAAAASGIGSRRQQAVKMEKNSSAAAAVNVVSKQLKPRFAVELDGLNCFETLVVPR